jgi:mRNA-degrading endonuclease RelE of RelBE toxin-antitoxin system
MEKDQIFKKTEEVGKIHQKYMDKLSALKKEQDKIIQEFVAELEKRKMEEIRNKLGLF